ncbi:hypothetical protein EJ06DRAFT_414944 [Trichodelitschia bisporula]|uniref:Uncharacterized protein n=1 Tax=Trichodelitschia bisporula TaxID=703511 RepID=A0A6G1HYD7_9PEZI|nr:hypothetical protein EJ06DRAFT_414944 [Trichodelitschia bisporula]
MLLNLHVSLATRYYIFSRYLRTLSTTVYPLKSVQCTYLASPRRPHGHLNQPAMWFPRSFDSRSVTLVPGPSLVLARTVQTSTNEPLERGAKPRMVAHRSEHGIRIKCQHLALSGKYQRCPCGVERHETFPSRIIRRLGNNAKWDLALSAALSRSLRAAKGWQCVAMQFPLGKFAWSGR